jgi:hypothetical protein
MNHENTNKNNDYTDSNNLTNSKSLFKEEDIDSKSINKSNIPHHINEARSLVLPGHGHADLHEGVEDGDDDD